MALEKSERQVGTTTTSLATLIEGYSYWQSTGGTNLVKSGAGIVHTITFSQNDSAPTAGIITFYDNTAASGTIILNHTQTTTTFMPVTITLDASFTNGLYVNFNTTQDVNVTVTYR